MPTDEDRRYVAKMLRQFADDYEEGSPAHVLCCDLVDLIEQTDEARKALPREYSYGSRDNYEVDWRGIIGKEVEKRVGAIIDERTDEIVDMAVKRVYDSIIRRKPFREACKKMDIIFDGIGGDSDD